MTKGERSTTQDHKDKGNSLLCDESEIEEEEPVERVMYTSSNPPSVEE